MATPALTAVSASAIVIPGSAGSMRINTLDAAGAVKDVGTGFTNEFLNAVPSGNANPAAAPVDLSSLVTPAFDTTGVTLAYTAAQATSIAAALPTLQSSCGVGLSNDAGTTATLAGIIAITVRPDANLQA